MIINVRGESKLRIFNIIISYRMSTFDTIFQLTKMQPSLAKVECHNEYAPLVYMGTFFWILFPWHHMTARCTEQKLCLICKDRPQEIKVLTTSHLRADRRNPLMGILQESELSDYHFLYQGCINIIIWLQLWRQDRSHVGVNLKYYQLGLMRFCYRNFVTYNRCVIYNNLQNIFRVHRNGIILW